MGQGMRNCRVRRHPARRSTSDCKDAGAIYYLLHALWAVPYIELHAEPYPHSGPQAYSFRVRPVRIRFLSPRQRTATAISLASGTAVDHLGAWPAQPPSRCSPRSSRPRHARPLGQPQHREGTVRFRNGAVPVAGPLQGEWP
jgi:hypothetical protein